MKDSIVKKIDKNTYFFLAAILSIFVPAPGRFAYALTLLLLFNVQMVVITLFFHAIDFLKLESLKNVLMVLSLVFVTIMFKQLLIVVCPIMALTLGFCIYLPTFSTVAIQFFFEKRKSSLREHFFDGVSKTLMFSAYSLLFFLLREIIGYSTVSFPGFGGLIVFHLPVDFHSVSFGPFFATIPGCLSLVAVLFALYILIQRKFEIIQKTRMVVKIGKDGAGNANETSGKNNDEGDGK